MKVILKVCLSLLLSSFVLGNMLYGQFYHEDISLPATVYSNSPYQAIVEEPQSGYLIATTGIDECPSCPHQNVNIQVFTPTGNVIPPSFQAGLPNVSEIPYAIALTNNPDEVIIVGEQVDTPITRAFAMRVDWVNGNVIWYRSYDAFVPNLTRDRFQGIQKVVDPNTGVLNFLFYGISQDVFPAGSMPKIYTVIVDINGNQLASFRRFPNPGTGTNLGFDPTDMTVNDKGHLIMTGTCFGTHFTGVAERDLFLLEMDVYGQLVSQLHRFDINDGSGTAIWNERPSIYADNPNGEYVLAFDSKDLSPSSPGNYALTTLRVQQGTNLPIGVPQYYFDTGFDNNRVSGIGEDPTGTGKLLIGTVHSLSYVGGLGDELGLLIIDPSLFIQDHIQYQPFKAQLGGYCMIVGQRGVYHQAVHPNTDEYRVLRSDYDGLGTVNCNFQVQPQQQPAFVSTRIVKMIADNEPAWLAHTPTVSQVTGNIDFCNGTSSSFKKPQPAVLNSDQNPLDFQVFPSLILSNEGVNLEVQATTSGMRVLRVINLNGQVLHTATLQLEVGKNAFELDATSFGPGMNLVQLTDPKGQTMVTRRVIRQ